MRSIGIFFLLSYIIPSVYSQIDHYTLLNISLAHLNIPTSSLLRYESALRLFGGGGKVEWSERNLKKEYRRMAKVHHPDKKENR